MYKRLRAFAYQQLGPYKPEHGTLSSANCLIVTVILVSLLMFTLESDPTYQVHDTFLLKPLTFIILSVFAAEFFARLFAAGHAEEYRGVRGHLLYLRHN
ncbi:MAG: hypothetical protein ACKVH7_12790, partial [Alphaproteobacteria bacterium]